MNSQAFNIQHIPSSTRPVRASLAGAALTAGICLMLGACGSNGSASGTTANSSTASGTSATTTTSATTCDVSTQPACPSTVPSYSGQVENIFATYCLQCHDPNGVGSAVTTTSGMGTGGTRPAGDANMAAGDPNAALNPNFSHDPNFTNSNPNAWDPSDAHDWSKYSNIHSNATLIEQQVFLCNMPPNGATPLSAADKQALLDWLACGAPNN